MLETLANWGEFLGGIAVVISLIYLAVQVRSSVKQARMDSYIKASELWLQWTNMVVSSDEAARIFYTGSQDFAGLSQEEKARFNQIISMYFGILDTIMLHEREDVAFPEETLRRTKETAYGVYKLPGVQEWWQLNKGRVFAPTVEQYLWNRQQREKGTD